MHDATIKKNCGVALQFLSEFIYWGSKRHCAKFVFVMGYVLLVVCLWHLYTNSLL